MSWIKPILSSVGTVCELLLLEGQPKLIAIHHGRHRNKISFTTPWIRTCGIMVWGFFFFGKYLSLAEYITVLQNRRTVIHSWMEKNLSLTELSFFKEPEGKLRTEIHWHRWDTRTNPLRIILLLEICSLLALHADAFFTFKKLSLRWEILTPSLYFAIKPSVSN